MKACVSWSFPNLSCTSPYRIICFTHTAFFLSLSIVWIRSRRSKWRRCLDWSGFTHRIRSTALNNASLQQFHNGILIGPRRHSRGTWCQSFLFLALSLSGCPSCHAFTGFPFSLSAPFYFWNYLNYLLHRCGLFLTPPLLRLSLFFLLGWMRKRYIRGRR